jgi:HAD superfamily hydrolase (TIGR01459 family)
MKAFPHLLSITQPFTGILLDAYGVFWAGNSAGLLLGSKEAMEDLVKQGKIVGILSNSTQPAAKEIDKLQKHGLLEGKHFHFLLTSGEIAKEVFRLEKLPFPTPRKKYWLLGESHPKYSSHQHLFQDSAYSQTPHLHEADFIYISIPHIKGEDQTDPAAFEEEIKKLTSSGLPMVCSNPDRFAHEGNPPRAVVRQGSLAALYEKLGGRVFYMGKPSQQAFAAAMDHFGHYKITTPAEILMVGDTPETDIRGAHLFGMSSALVTQTGILADRISAKGLEKTLDEFPVSDVPDFLIERLGDFELHPNLARKIFIHDLPLCRVLLEDEQHYPWIFLVPRRPGIKKMMDLSPQDQLQLMTELDKAQKIIWQCFSPDQLNVAAIGNKTPQLHVHVIARYASDPAWPGTVWDHPVRSAYSPEEKQRRIQLLEKAFKP